MWATDNDDNKSLFSTYGAWVDIAAPGVSVDSTFPNHRFVLAREYNRSQAYDIGSGMSMSSPIVAAVVALARSASPGWTNSAIRNKVESSTDPVGAIGTDWAHGRVNAYNAVKPPLPQPARRLGRRPSRMLCYGRAP
ncbi:S8 family serine peptidase [Pseudarthrobacter quantipunctorum]|uniref:S8 family serine peptidase n=1 Tax=Pseudarthrobacter quantipunctorum TaxID=3128980 RepID=A0ABZ2R2U2_9MICC